MVQLSRRSFLKGTAAVAGIGLLGPQAVPASSALRISSGTDLVSLGNTGLRTTVLGIGTGTNGGRQQRELGMEGFIRLFRYAYESGLRYVDTADAYMTHLYVREAMRGLPREEFFILTKTRAKHPEVARADIERFRRELNTPYLDCVLMHCMTTGDFPTQMRPVLDVLLEEKAKGRIRAVGVSCHGYEPLVASVDCPDLDVHLVRINPFKLHMDEDADKVIAEMQKMAAKGRGVLGMKIYGETGYDSREKRLEALKLALGCGCVHAFTIGFTRPEQIDETLELIEEAAKAA
jgi:aryl-alcohol dehydrogenase-like predicted oxidoreductase